MRLKTLSLDHVQAVSTLDSHEIGRGPGCFHRTLKER